MTLSDTHSKQMELNDSKSREGARGVQNSVPPGAQKWLRLSALRARASMH